MRYNSYNNSEKHRKAADFSYFGGLQIMKERRVMKLASREKRLGAFCIDFIIPFVGTIIFIIAFTILMVASMPFSGGFGYGYGYPEFGYGYGYGIQGHGGAKAALAFSILLWIAYIVIQMVFYNKSKTIGKAALGLQVVSSRNGDPVGFWKMLFREWFVKQASGCVFLLGFIWVLIDEKNRGWHDKILDTYVVDLKESEAMNAASGNHVRRPAPKSAPVYTQPVETVPAVDIEAVAEGEISESAKENIIDAAETAFIRAQETVSGSNADSSVSEDAAAEKDYTDVLDIDKTSEEISDGAEWTEDEQE